MNSVITPKIIDYDETLFSADAESHFRWIRRCQMPMGPPKMYRCFDYSDYEPLMSWHATLLFIITPHERHDAPLRHYDGVTSDALRRPYYCRRCHIIFDDVIFHWWCISMHYRNIIIFFSFSWCRQDEMCFHVEMSYYFDYRSRPWCRRRCRFLFDFVLSSFFRCFAADEMLMIDNISPCAGRVSRFVVPADYDYADYDYFDCVGRWCADWWCRPWCASQNTPITRISLFSISFSHFDWLLMCVTFSISD